MEKKYKLKPIIEKIDNMTYFEWEEATKEEKEIYVEVVKSRTLEQV